MNTSGEAADQVVRMTLNGTEMLLKITGRGAAKLAGFLYHTISALSKEGLSGEDIFYGSLEGSFRRLQKEQAEIKKVLQFILTPDESSTMQNRVFYYLACFGADNGLEFSSPEYRMSPSEEIPCGIEIKQLVYSKNIRLVEDYSFRDILQIALFELVKMCGLDLNIKVCKFCGNFFIPKSRSDTEYCDRIKTGEQKTCIEIGPMRMYQDKTKDSPIFIVYNRAYKRMNARVRSKKLTQMEFLQWSDTAREKRDLALEGKLSETEFIKWCDISR